ncbi:MAG: hypothetical protein AAFR16_13610 [Pseudomonadota bacterium]
MLFDQSGGARDAAAPRRVTRAEAARLARRLRAVVDGLSGADACARDRRLAEIDQMLSPGAPSRAAAGREGARDVE